MLEVVFTVAVPEAVFGDPPPMVIWRSGAGSVAVCLVEATFLPVDALGGADVACSVRRTCSPRDCRSVEGGTTCSPEASSGSSPDRCPEERWSETRIPASSKRPNPMTSASLFSRVMRVLPCFDSVIGVLMVQMCRPWPISILPSVLSHSLALPNLMA